MIYVIGDFATTIQIAHLIGQKQHREVTTLSTPDDFLASYRSSEPGCVILCASTTQPAFMREAHARILSHELRVPLLIVSSNADVQEAIWAFRNGAIDFLLNPTATDLDLAVSRVLSLEARRQRGPWRLNPDRIAALKPGERDVLDRLIEGLPNKSIASSLGISLRTVEDRRSKIMHKLEVDSLPSLLRVVFDVN